MLLRSSVHDLRLLPMLTAVATIVLLGSGGTAGAEPRKVLLADPQVAPDVGPALAKDLSVYVRSGLEKVGATPLNAETTEVQDQMKKIGVASLASREDSIKVARAVGAHALLRYRAKMEGDKIKVSLAIYLTDAGKAVMLEKTVPPLELSGTVDKMVLELIGAAPAEPVRGAVEATPGAPEPEPEPETPSSAPASQPASTTRSAFWDPAPHAHSGLAANFHIGGSAPLGGSTNDEFLESSVRVGLHLGYQLKIGSRHAITPEIAVLYNSWGFKDGTTFLGDSITGGVGMFNLLGGIRYALYIGPIETFVAGHFGLAHVSHSIASTYDPTIEVPTESQTGFAFNVELGGHFMFLRYLGAGLFFDVTKGFVDDLTATDPLGTSHTVDYDAIGFSAGLSVKGKLPL